MSASSLPFVVASAGVATHLCFFKIGEHWQRPTRYIQALLLGCIITTVAKSHYGNVPTRDAVAFTAQICFTVFGRPLHQSYRLSSLLQPPEQNSWSIHGTSLEIRPDSPGCRQERLEPLLVGRPSKVRQVRTPSIPIASRLHTQMVWKSRSVPNPSAGRLNGMTRICHGFRCTPRETRDCMIGEEGYGVQRSVTRP